MSAPVRLDTRPTDTAPPVAPTSSPARQRRLLVGLALAALAAAAAFLLVDVTGSWEFAVRLRARKVAAMTLVAVAVAVSTVSFQTVTNNRILTPSIMGFDSLYVLLQSLAVYAFGTVAVVAVGVEVRFVVETVVLVAFALVLHRCLFGRSKNDDKKIRKKRRKIEKYIL